MEKRKLPTVSPRTNSDAAVTSKGYFAEDLARFLRYNVINRNIYGPLVHDTVVMLNDIFNSEDGLHIFKHLHVHLQVWLHMDAMLRRWRQKLPAHPQSVVVAHERHRNNLHGRSKALVLEDRPNDTRSCPWSVTEGEVSSSTEYNRMRNEKDVSQGKKAVCSEAIVAKFLRKGYHST